MPLICGRECGNMPLRLFISPACPALLPFPFGRAKVWIFLFSRLKAEWG